MHVAARKQRPAGGRCGTPAWVEDYRELYLVDLRRSISGWYCGSLRVASWTIEHPEIAPAAQKLTTRAGRWATEQVSRYAHSGAQGGRGVAPTGTRLDDAVVVYGEALLEARRRPDRHGPGPQSG